MATEILLNCHLWGDKPGNFTVNTALDDNVSILKSKVKKRKVAFLNTVALSSIRLFKLKIPRLPNEMVLADFENNAEELDDWLEKISNLFNAPSRTHIHIIVLPDRRLASFYLNAWGQQWPQHKGTISCTDMVPIGRASRETMVGSVIDETSAVVDGEGADPVVDHDDSSAIGILDDFEYICFEGISQVRAVLSIIGEVQDVLVVLREYENLRERMEQGVRKRGLVVTGQPGIGSYDRKTGFLLYLLLHRLENKLPTAVQFRQGHYIIFDEHGAMEVAVTVKSEQLRERLAKCWALADSNADVVVPCGPFQEISKLVIQASSPRVERWKQWTKYVGGTVVVSDPPQTVEILAIAKELNFSLSSAFSLVNKWGPSVRSIIEILKSEAPKADEYSLKRAAERAAREICANPFTFSSTRQEAPSSLDSTMLFLQPRHLPNVTSIHSKQLGTFYIPSAYLSKIFENVSIHLTNEKALELFECLSSHSLTRDSEGWQFERQMHRHMCIHGAALPIYNRVGERDEMTPSANLFTGGVTALELAQPKTAFYWLPSASNCPGVDGVLGDGDGNIYAVQATLPKDHSSPIKGLRLVWAKVRRTLHNRWCFVIVGQTKGHVDNLVAKYSKELKRVTFASDSEAIELEVWGCVFNPSKRHASPVSNAGGSNEAAQASPVTPSERPSKTRRLTRSQGRVLADTGK